MRQQVMLYDPAPEELHYADGPIHTVPNQSMSLKEILRRFIKREALPVEKEGVYFESEYDLEKLRHEDITVKHEVLAEVKKDVERKKRKVEEFNRPPASPDPKPVDPPPPA